MAQANLGSRRGCEAIIEQGRVRVNGKMITLGDKADPAVDRIEVDGQLLKLNDLETLYIAFNKPLNVLSSSVAHKSDDRPTVIDLVDEDANLHMVGRLDAESEGLMVLTNDGDLTNRLTHPRYRHTKTYRVTVHGLPSADAIDQWQRGVELEDGKTAPCLVRVKRGDNKFTTLEIVMTEGKKRQIRRVASQLGYPVHRLRRTAIGQLTLHGLGIRPGEKKVLTEKEVKLLRSTSPDLKLIGKDIKGRKPPGRPPRRRHR